MDGLPTRVVIRACVTDIPDVPQRRHTTLGEAFCKSVLDRDFNWKLDSSGYDHIHIPSDFDSDQPLRRWFILDLNVKKELTKDEVIHIPHQAFLASFQSGELIFVSRQTWVDRARQKTYSYTWGGKIEQRELALLQKQIDDAEAVQRET